MRKLAIFSGPHRTSFVSQLSGITQKHLDFFAYFTSYNTFLKYTVQIFKIMAFSQVLILHHRMMHYRIEFILVIQLEYKK